MGCTQSQQQSIHDHPPQSKIEQQQQQQITQQCGNIGINSSTIDHQNVMYSPSIDKQKMGQTTMMSNNRELTHSNTDDEKQDYNDDTNNNSGNNNDLSTQYNHSKARVGADTYASSNVFSRQQHTNRTSLTLSFNQGNNNSTDDSSFCTRGSSRKLEFVLGPEVRNIIKAEHTAQKLPRINPDDDDHRHSSHHHRQGSLRFSNVFDSTSRSTIASELPQLKHSNAFSHHQDMMGHQDPEAYFENQHNPRFEQILAKTNYGHDDDDDNNNNGINSNNNIPWNVTKSPMQQSNMVIVASPRKRIHERRRLSLNDPAPEDDPLSTLTNRGIKSPSTTQMKPRDARTPQIATSTPLPTFHEDNPLPTYHEDSNEIVPRTSLYSNNTDGTTPSVLQIYNRAAIQHNRFLEQQEQQP